MPAIMNMDQIRLPGSDQTFYLWKRIDTVYWKGTQLNGFDGGKVYSEDWISKINAFYLLAGIGIIGCYNPNLIIFGQFINLMFDKDAIDRIDFMWKKI